MSYNISYVTLRKLKIFLLSYKFITFKFASFILCCYFYMNNSPRITLRNFIFH